LFPTRRSSDLPGHEHQLVAEHGVLVGLAAQEHLSLDDCAPSALLDDCVDDPLRDIDYLISDSRAAPVQLSARDSFLPDINREKLRHSPVVGVLKPSLGLYRLIGRGARRFTVGAELVDRLADVPPRFPQAPCPLREPGARAL